MIRYSDAAKLSGHIKIVARYDDDTRVTLVDQSNHIVTGYLTAVSGLITQQNTDLSPEQYAVNSLWVEASDTALIHPVTAEDDAPEGLVISRYVFDRDSDVTTNVGGDAGLVEFKAILGKNDGNGEIVRAVGLYTQGDDAANPDTAANVILVARQLVGAIPKDPAFALEFTWRLQTIID